MLVLTFAFTGYSLVYDQLSYWANDYLHQHELAELPFIGKPLLSRCCAAAPRSIRIP